MADYSVITLGRPNLSGYCRVTFCTVEQLDSSGWPKVVQSALQGDITLASGENFSSIPLLESSMQFSELPDAEGGALFYTTTISGRLPMALAARDDLFRSMQQLRWLVIGTDGNGNQRVLGTPKYPARFSFSHDNSRQRNEYVIEWTARTPNPALYAEGVEAPEPGVCSPATLENSDASWVDIAASGATKVLEDMTLDYPDSTTETVPVDPGGTVHVDPEFVFIPESGASSGSFITPALDGSFTCTGFTIDGGGSISNIVHDGGAPVSSPVGISFEASAPHTFDMSGTVNWVTYHFS